MAGGVMLFAGVLLGQLPDLTGVAAEGSSSLAKAWNVVTHLGGVDPATLLTGLAAIALLVALARSPWSLWGALAAVVLPTVAVVVMGLDVAVVSDGGDIPQGVPTPHLPDLGLLSADLVLGALAVAAIVLVQGVGVSESAPNPGGTPSDTNRDFTAQGLGNLASALFRGQPVGGSVGQTALNVAAGARTRWAAVWSGLWMLVILVALSGVVGRVAMPTLSAVLVVAAAGSLRLAALRTILRTGPIAQIAVLTTFTATLFLSVPAAVGIGVALSLLLQLNQEAMDLTVVQLMPDADGRLVERRLPPALPDHEVTVIDVYGSLFYAGARTLQARLPDPARSTRPVVVLRLRGRTTLGATFFAVVGDYAERLARVDGRLYLSGVDPGLMERMPGVDAEGPVTVRAATPVVGESTLAAVLDAETWLVRHFPGGAGRPPGPDE
jgi:SulP family sulfate permease